MSHKNLRHINYVVEYTELGGHKLPRYFMVVTSLKAARKLARKRSEATGKFYVARTYVQWYEECEKFWKWLDSIEAAA